MEIKSLNINRLPSYEIEFLKSESIVLCKFLNDVEDFKENCFYALSLELVLKYQSQGDCYFVEKVGGDCNGS
jgi:hypothetical protein